MGLNIKDIHICKAKEFAFVSLLVQPRFSISIEISSQRKDGPTT